jgi:hypothetical protein
MIASERAIASLKRSSRRNPCLGVVDMAGNLAPRGAGRSA